MSEVKAKEIKLVDLVNLVENPKNNNKHPQAQIERLAKLIAHTGFRNPLVVSNRSGFVLCGHGRIAAAKLAGLSAVPVIYQDFKDEAEEYAYMTSDNAIGAWAELNLEAIQDDIALFGGFDVDLLGIEDFKIEIETPKEEKPSAPSSAPCQKVKFLLSNEQKDILDQAIEKAKKQEQCSDELNQDPDGNALAAIMKRYLLG